MSRPKLSIIVPTFNSARFLPIVFQGLEDQTADKKGFEVIIADNQSRDETKQLAASFGATVIDILGLPPQVCVQRNAGVKVARGEYVLIIDHDMELSKDLVQNFLTLVSDSKLETQGWYVPEKIIASSLLLRIVRNFESNFYKDSPIAAARLVKKSKFLETPGFDPALSGGPADWDFDIQLHLTHTKLDNLQDVIYHHEEGLGFWQYIFKKGRYIAGGEIYKQKWRTQDKEVYNSIVAKQYNPFYRLFGIFVEKGKWRKLLVKLPTYFLFLFVKLTMAAIYFYRLKKQHG